MSARARFARLSRLSRRDRGAVAVVVGILSVVLFSSAALTVDLGNAWSRKRAVQKQVDISAVAAGIKLPATLSNRTEIATEVAAYLNKASNTVSGAPVATAAQLIDGNSANGELTFYDDNNTACDLAGATPCTVMRVLSPPAKVDFGLAGIMGFHSTNVQRVATVKVESVLPGMQDTLPFWLPQGCGFGSAEADTTGGSGPSSPSPTPTTTTPTTSPTASATATSTATATPTAPTEEVGTHVLSGSNYTVVQGGSVTIKGFVISGIDTAKTDRATIRIYAPDFSWFIDFAAQDKQAITNPLNVPDFTVSSELTNTPGVWHVYAYIQPKSKSTPPSVSSTSLTLTVTGTAPTSPTGSTSATSSSTPSASTSASTSPSNVPINCIGQDRGNFGQLESPRKDEGNLQKAFALNIAYGLDHLIQPFCDTPGNSCPPDPNKDCGKADGDIPGGLVDNVPANGKNCIKGDTGNDGPKTFDGLFGGGGITTGRLDVANGATRCPNNRTTRTSLTISGRTINNDVLSCYLTESHTLDEIAQLSGVNPTMLDQSVVDSPRFVWLPVVFANDRAQKNYQPIKDFVPAFITDETQTSSATADNGTQINGNSVKVLKVFVFNKDALDPKSWHNSTDYDPTLGQKIVRLVD